MSDDVSHLRADPGAALHAPATQRNRGPILEVLERVLPRSGIVLEVASGTGEHAAWFARHLRPLVWRASDPDPQLRASIAAHAEAAGLNDQPPPLALDATDETWPLGSADAVVCINLVHIAPWRVAEGLFAGAAGLLEPGGVLYLYGPFRREGRHTSASNAAFDASLRAQNPAWGVRDLEAMTELGQACGFTLPEILDMPANNLSLVFHRAAAGPSSETSRS